MFKTLRRFFTSPPDRNHWDAPEIWRETPQTRFEVPASRKRANLNHPTRYL